MLYLFLLSVHSLDGQTMASSTWQTTKPVVCGALVGLILGDLRTGIIIGGTLTLVYMGVQGVGAAIPVNATTATTVTTALCIITGVEMETAIAIAVPVSRYGSVRPYGRRGRSIHR